MKLLRLLLKILLLGGLLLILSFHKSNSVANNYSILQTSDTGKVNNTQIKDNPYKDLRNLAFNATPEKLGISLPIDSTVVYGVIMDWQIGNGVSTTVAYQTGDASIYFSTGGGIIGGVAHEDINIAAKWFVYKAQGFLEKASKADTTASLGKDEVRFYFLTNKGIFVGQDELINFKNKSSIWLDLFDQGNKVITAIRLTKEK